MPRLPQGPPRRRSRPRSHQNLQRIRNRGQAMPVTLSYPGLYIEELPSSAHTITAAPTSIAVFIGYTHPFKTLKFGEAVRVFNFTEYERNFGGLYANGR